MFKWKLRLNAAKCKTILLTPLKYANSNVRNHWRNFLIYADADRRYPIANMQTVRYLGIHIDHIFHYTKPIKNCLCATLESVFFTKILTRMLK